MFHQITNKLLPVPKAHEAQVQFDHSSRAESVKKAVVSANHIDECVTSDNIRRVKENKDKDQPI
jgi:hypothetical protein